jgi:ABC-type multidrug transport system fused ATPase/permease subunit
MVRFAEMRTHYLASVVLERYLSQPYVYFLNKHSADLGLRVLSDVVQIVTGVLLPLLQLVSQLLLAVLLLGLLFAVNPRLSLMVFLGLGGIYVLIYRGVRTRLSNIGVLKAAANARQFRALSEASGAIKEIKLLHLERTFLDRFKAPNLQIARAVADQAALSLAPNYLMETVAFGGILIVVLVMLATGRNLSNVLPLVGLYGYAILRIKPALQTVYGSVSQIRANEPILDRVCDEFQAFRVLRSTDDDAGPQVEAKLAAMECIELRNINFRYPGATDDLFANLNLRIDAGSSVAFVGMTGSGKSTLVDIILGLLVPDGGALYVDGLEITDSNRRRWQASVSYVPQHIYLADDTVLRNIGFGVETSEIDLADVKRAASAANIDEFVLSELPEGYATRIGERGVRLSGGQRQRVGVARALYRDANVLVLDEATSALDTITEAALLRAIGESQRRKTVIMVAHRITTIRDCDMIFLLDRGRIVARGTYETLMEESEQFRALSRMADNASLSSEVDELESESAQIREAAVD